ncbi:MAG: type II secretion system protein [Geobacteraceae bacterium]
MVANPLKSSDGFTYLMALVIVVIMGIMLGGIGQSWQRVMKREREEELLFRGNQIRDAIARWNKPRPGQHQATPLKDMEHLLSDPRSMTNVRYLRRLYTDPLTNKEWVLITDPIKGIIGVASSSEEAPLKQANFPNEFRDLEGKTKYSDWRFVYMPQPPPQPSGVTK